MPSKVTIPNTFAAATTAIPLSQLDANFSNVNAAINNALTFSNYAVDAGTANNYSITITGQTTTYAAGLAFQFLAANANSGASTLNVNGQGAKSIIKSTGGALTAGDISAGAIISVMYDGTNFQLLNDTASGSETFTNITVTGTATINTANVTTFSPAITNAQLANSAITIGNTAVSLGGTITTINNATLVNANVSSGTVSVSSITDSGNLTFTGTGNRITGDFSNATVANRVMFQTSTTNGNTVINLIPNGTGTICAFGMDSDPATTNSSTGSLNLVASTDVRLTSGIRGTGTYLPMTFYTGGSERMRIDTSGNVGIGTSSPSYRLHVSGTAVGSAVWVNSHNTDATTAGATGGFFGSNGAVNAVLYAAGQALVGVTGTTTNHPFLLYTNGTERMRITAAGNVGIGTSSPVAKLQSAGAAATATPTGGSATGSGFYINNTDTAFGMMFGNSGNGDGWIQQQRSDSTNTQYNLLLQPIGGNVGIGITSPARTLSVYAASNPVIQLVNSTTGTAATDGLLMNISGVDAEITNRENGTLALGTNSTERARITSGGELILNRTTLIGTERFSIDLDGSKQGQCIRSTNTSGNPNIFRIMTGQLSGGIGTGRFITCDDGGGDKFFVAGSGTVNSTSTSITAISDQRLKENVRDLETGLPEIMQLKPRRFDWKESQGTGKKNVVGFIAQEVEPVLPDLIGEWKNQDDETTYKSLAMGDMLPTLVKAIQELKSELDAAKARIATLES